MEIPSNIPGGIMAAAAFFVATWLLLFALRSIFVSPFKMFQASKTQITMLQNNLNICEERLRDASELPEVTILTEKHPLVLERERFDEEKGAHPGILIAYRDLRIINRRRKRISIEFKLKINVWGHFYYNLDPMSVRTWRAVRCDEPAVMATIGDLFQDVIDVEGEGVATGSLAFFIPSEDEAVRRSVFLTLLRRSPSEQPWEIILRLPKILEATDHLSGRRVEFDATREFSFTATFEPT